MVSNDVIPAQQVARQAGLRYMSDARPGIRRKPHGKHFRYIGTDGTPVRDKSTLERIRSLAIPPAWTDVWISPARNGHIQATGRDAKGRKQYRYHTRWREVRDETKYHRMIAFGESLPALRERLQRDLSCRDLSRYKILATVVRLLDETAIRVGNEEYARENQSYGLTTLKDRHVDVSGATLHFRFVGKGGKEHAIDVRDRRVARIVKRMEELPGHELFQYEDENGTFHKVESDDVNAYLQEVTEQAFTAKDFRTWHGTVRAAEALYEIGTYETQTQAKHNIGEAIKEAANLLGNTPAICRKSYVNPEIIDAYHDGSLRRAFDGGEAAAARYPGLNTSEAAVLELLLQHDKNRHGQVA